MGISSTKDDQNWQKKRLFSMKLFGGKSEEKKNTSEKVKKDPDIDEICTKMEALNIKNQKTGTCRKIKNTDIKSVENSDSCTTRNKDYVDSSTTVAKQNSIKKERKPTTEREDKPNSKMVPILSKTVYAGKKRIQPNIYQNPDEFTVHTEDRVRAFFFGFQNKKNTRIAYNEGSIIDTCPVLKKIHQRALSLRTHNCMYRGHSTNNKTPLTYTCGKRDRSNQTDFPPETWINEETTVKYNKEFVNVVSANQEDENIMKKGETASRQKTLVQLALLTVLDGSGYARRLKEKIKREDSHYNFEEQRIKLITLCREQIESFSKKYEEENGPLPIDQEEFGKSLYHFVATFAKPLLFKKILEHNKKQDRKKENCSNSLKNIFNGLFAETPELNDIKIAIIHMHGRQIQKLGETEKSKEKDGKEKIVKNTEKKDDQEERKEFNERQENGENDVSDNNACGDSPDQSRKQTGAKKVFIYGDVNPVGPFDRGTHYRTDGEVVVEKCKRGSRKELQSKPKKVKTRGVPNKHLRQSVIPVQEADFNEKLGYDKNVKGAEIDYLFDNLESALLERVGNVMGYTGESVEFTEDKRHLTEFPAQIIHGKKNDCDLLEAKYGAQPNKRQKEHKKKQQRSKRQTTIQFGLNVNNSADDSFSWSADEDDTDSTATISDSSHLIAGENINDCFPPTITFSVSPLNETRPCAT